MGFPLVLGSFFLTYIPAAVLINYTILPYAFITATFLKSIFYHICSLAFVAIFWLAFQAIPVQYAYLMILILYITLTYTVRLYIIDDAQHEYNSFSIVSSNNALHPTHPIHRGWGIGVGWGLSEATIFFGLPILTQFGGIIDSATIFPSPTTQCGTFSPSFTPFPILLPTAVMWIAVFLIIAMLTTATSIVRSYCKNPCAIMTLHFLNLLIHYGLYAVTWGVRSTGWCLAPIVVPLSFLLSVGLYLWALKATFIKGDPTVSKLLSSASLTAERLRQLRLSRSNRTGNDDDLDSTTFDRGEATRGNYTQFQDDQDDQDVDQTTRNHNDERSLTHTTPHQRTIRSDYGSGNSGNEGEELLFQDYGRNDQNDVYGDRTIQ